MTAHSLNVFDASTRVGAVEYESLNDGFSFHYDQGWAQAEGGYSISPHIAKSGPGASSGTIRRFLENLLPEGRALDIVAGTFQVARNNVYGLLRQLGQETTGALSFLVTDPQERPTTRREITRAELEERIERRAEVPFAVWDGRVRMSIAGYQDKLSVYMEDSRIYLVEGELASTHILKPGPADGRLPMLVANEHYCMSLGKRLGLPVAPVSILRVPEPLLIVERFDRVREAGRVRRLHAIDGCQALDFPVAYKYERNFGSGRDVRDIRDGVSFERLFSIVEHTVEKALTRMALLRWAIFQYLIGNCDAHGKNISFFCRPAGLTLAPCYDLVSVVQYDGLDHELAMAYGDVFELENVRPYAWAVFGERAGIPRRLLSREMQKMGRMAIEAAVQQAADESYLGDEKAQVAKISAYVQGQAQKLIEMARPLLRVDLD